MVAKEVFEVKSKPNVLRDLAAKFVLIGVVCLIGLTVLGPMNWMQSLTTALWVTIIAYLAGDLVVLRYAGNGWAVFSDFLISAFVVWLVAVVMSVSLVNWQIWFTGLLVGMGEYVYHRYLISVGYHHRTGLPGRKTVT